MAYGDNSYSPQSIPPLYSSTTPQPFLKNYYNPASGNGFGNGIGTIPYISNPAYGGFGSGMNGGGGNGQPSTGDIFSGGSRSTIGGRTNGVYNNNFSGGGSQNFSTQGQPGDYNPYQFMPSFSDFNRPSSPIAGETPEEEYLRQFMMGQLLGDHPGENAAYDELYSTVSGDYLHPDSNPYLTESINALGADTTNQLNNSINQILSRAGTGGALGGSRSALMQGQAGGESVRGFNETVANLLNSNYQQERNRQQGAIPGLVGLDNAPTARTGEAMGLAGVPRQFEQQNINARMGEWLRQQNERLLPLQTGQSILGQRMGQTVPIVQPQQSTLAGLGQLGQGLGSLFSGAKSMGMFGGTATPNAGTPYANPANGYSGGYGNYDPFNDGYGEAGAGASSMWNNGTDYAGGEGLNGMGAAGWGNDFFSSLYGNDAWNSIMSLGSLFTAAA